MHDPVQAAVTGKLILQCLQSAVSKRQSKMEEQGGDEKVFLMPVG
jgi:hypothetical protein